MLIALVLAVFLVLVALVSWLRARGKVPVSTCCGARPWPPDDLSAAG